MVSLLFSIIAGLIGLLIGGTLLVQAAVAIAARLGVSPLLIGLVLVGFGTSTLSCSQA
jgi:cation:H+ antiporter